MFVHLANGVNATAVEKYARDCFENGIYIRALQVIKGKEPMLRLAFEPHGFDDPMHMYSLSKSFTSVACGICIDNGLLSKDTRICELFADKMPENISQELSELKLSDLLSMQSGHEVCALASMRWAEDSLKAFFEQSFAYKPGTTFVYDTGATCVCAAAVERVTGMKLVDFLDEKLFKILDIKKPRWVECRDGQTLGGTGLYISSNDLTKFGMMLKSKGVYNGIRIVSEEYLADATSVHSVDINNGSPDWTAGYGFQFWQNARGGFRGDGAFGQLCMVFPEEDTVVTLLGEVGNMSSEVQKLYTLLDTMYGDNADASSLSEFVSNAYKPNKTECFNNDISFTVAENAVGINTIRLFGESLLHVEMQTDYGKKEFVCGNGEYILNHVMLKCMNPTIVYLDPSIGRVERINVFASYELLENGIINITLRHQDNCHVQRWTLDTINGKLDIALHVGGLSCTSFSLSPVVVEAAE